MDGGDDVELAAVVHANRYQFAPGETITNRLVESRAAVWASRGAGAVRVGGRAFEVTPGTVLLLPWRHDIRYVADRADPFLVSAVHVTPWNDPAHPIQPGAAHGADDPLAGSPVRADRNWTGLSGLRFTAGDPARELRTLGEVAISEFLQGPVSQGAMRALGILFVHAALRAARSVASTTVLPPALITMQEYVASHLQSPLSTAEVAAVAGCSESTAERLFRRHTGTSVQRWVRQTRMAESARLLLTSNLRVSQVAVRVGYTDPLYFSRVFRAHHGVPPSRFATGTSRL